MKTYINEMSKECTLTLTETKKIDDWMEVIDLKLIKKVIEALKTLGKEIEGLYVQYVYMDIDNPYYRRFPEETTDKIYWRIFRGAEQKVYYKNERLYIIEDGHTIVCPRDMHNLHSTEKELKISIRWE